MLSGIDLNLLFTFPFKDAESRRYFLIGCLVSLAGFIVPILPYFVLYGYAIRIAKQIMNNEEPHMVAWDDWEGMFKDGAKLFGIRMIYSLPIFILFIPLFMSMFAMPILASTASSSELDTIFPIFMLLGIGTMCVLIPISLPLTIITPAAEMYVADKDEFAAGFRIREWWTIFQANIGGFVAAYAIFYLSSLVLTFAIQIVVATLIFACLLFFLVPAITPYIILIKYAVVAQVYKASKEKLTQSEIAEAAA